MIRHVLWQAVLAFVGIAAIFGILFQLTSTLTTVVVPTAGGTYIEAVMGYSEKINPILSPFHVRAIPVDQELTALVFEGLTKLDPSGQVVPSLAREWTVSEDGTVYEFRLQEGVAWHDGAPFTASDVTFTIQAMQDPGYQGDANLAELWLGVQAERVDDTTVRFTLTEPFPSFLYYTTIGLLPAHLLGSVPASELPEDPFTTDHPVGTGPFVVESVSPDRVILASNPDYWGQTTPLLDKLEFWFYDDEDELLADYDRGRIQGFHPSSRRRLASVAGLPTLQFYSAAAAGYGVTYLNLQRESTPFFQDRDVRQALLYALDRQALIDDALGGQGLVADSPLPPMLWAYDPTVRQYRYDPERAIGLLDASGWLDSDGDRVRDKDGREFSFTLLTVDQPDMVQMAEEMARQWLLVGIDVGVRRVSASAAATSVRSRSFDAILVEVGLTADPDPYPLWHSTQAGEAGQNFSGFANEDADLIMEESRTTVKRERRQELFSAFQHIFAEEVPALLIHYPVYTYAVDKQVEEVQLPPLLHTVDRFRNFADWHMLTAEVVVSEKEQLDISQD